MSKIKEAFKNGKAFIPFITGGDPDLETTKKLIIEMQNAGADIIEVGIPFSDPIAEGQVIQKADLKKKGQAEVPKWVQIMSARKRKTLVVCRECHVAIHNGNITKSS